MGGGKRKVGGGRRRLGHRAQAELRLRGGGAPKVSTRQSIAGAAADSAERSAPGIELLLVRALEERIGRSRAGLRAVG